MLTKQEEYRIGNCIIKIIPKTIIPINSDQEKVIHYTIEIHRKGILGSKLIKSQKYDPNPILTIRAFLRTIH